jgi:ABC-type Fe3+-hydroxamate transport system substrate-binding protein
MQFKLITAIIVLLLVVASLLVAGCVTSSDNTATNQPTTNGMISSLNKYFNSTKNMTMVNSFEQTIVDHTHNAYIGSFKDGADKLTPKLHNYTVIVASNSNDGQMLFAQQVNKTKSAGYVEITPTLDTQWHGYYKSSTSAANGEVYVTVCEPHNCTSTVANEFALQDPSSFVVTVDKISNA